MDLAEEWESETDKEEYRKAALEFRLPFWDYFRPRGGLVSFPGIFEDDMTSYPYDYSCPLAYSVDEIDVISPSTNLSGPIPNPLRSWKFEENFLSEKDWQSTGAGTSDSVRITFILLITITCSNSTGLLPSNRTTVTVATL